MVVSYSYTGTEGTYACMSSIAKPQSWGSQNNLTEHDARKHNE